mgnify:CR=1 FL=1|jgi:hypothetical protein
MLKEVITKRPTQPYNQVMTINKDIGWDEMLLNSAIYLSVSPFRLVELVSL